MLDCRTTTMHEHVSIHNLFKSQNGGIHEIYETHFNDKKFEVVTQD